MYIIKEDFVVAVDCDQTLIDWESGMNDITLTHNGITRHGRIMQKHVERLKMHKFWGNAVIVWSKSGSSFAQAVVNALDLKEYVDVVCAKTSWYYDDKKCQDFMGEHRFLYGEIK